jgi:tRNA(Ile)-lysidine synthase
VGTRRRIVAVGYSAGRDSTALLHATARAARELGVEVVALHVHHGLMPQADAWLAFAQKQVGRWAEAGLPVRLVSTRLQGQPAKGDSVEAWARQERRAALTRMARECGADAILLAHHRQDQAETVLLQALRGAGPAGLAAMPRAVQRDTLWWLRPWLDRPRSAIEAYVRQHKLRHVDDASNTDERFARGRLRATVWRALRRAFDDAEVTLTQVARRAHEAQAVLAEVAVHDLAACVDTTGRLEVTRWSELSQARRANALRAWLQVRLERGPPEVLVQRLLGELPGAAPARWPVDGGREVALYRGRLDVVAARSTDTPAARDELALDLSRPGVHTLPPWRGAFEVTPAEGPGVPAALLKACRVVARSGGEQWQAQPHSTARSLKKQYQAAGVAAWLRDGPLVYVGDRLVFVPGLGLDARVCQAAATKSRRLLALRWLPDGAPAPRSPGRGAPSG